MVYVVCICALCSDVCFSYFFFFKQKTAYEMRISDWSSDVCSSDLLGASVGFQKFVTPQLPRGTDIRNLPVAKAPEQEERRSRFATRMISRSSDPVAATDRITAPGGNPSVDVVSRSEEHTSELQSLMRISYAVFCLKKKKNTQ